MAQIQIFCHPSIGKCLQELTWRSKRITWSYFFLIPSCASLQIAQTQPISDVIRLGKHAWQFAASIRSPSGLIKSNEHATQKSKEGTIPPEAADTGGGSLLWDTSAQLAHPLSYRFWSFKAVGHNLFAEAMPQTEEPGKIAYKILATALEVDLWLGKSYKHLLSSKSFLAFLFPFLYVQHVFTVRCHTRTSITPAAEPKWALKPY